MNNWLGPFKTADDAMDNLRRTVAEIIGTDPHTWPNHKNAPLAIAAAIGLREGAIKQLIKERDALRIELNEIRYDAAHQKALAASALRVAKGWEDKCDELRAKIEGGSTTVIVSKFPVNPTDAPLYALPGAQTQGEEE